jgi:DtxR family transcriptional regulator, Mn-dependent transcriptional regulator
MESLRPGDEGVFVRVSDSDPAMLRYLAGCGISPGDRFSVRARQPFGGPLFVLFGERELAIGGQLADAMDVEVDQMSERSGDGAEIGALDGGD